MYVLFQHSIYAACKAYRYCRLIPKADRKKIHEYLFRGRHWRFLQKKIKKSIVLRHQLTVGHYRGCSCGKEGLQFA